MRALKASLVVVASLALLFLPAPTASQDLAEEIRKRQEELIDLERQIGEQKKKIEENRGRQRDLKTQIDLLNAQIRKTELEIQKLNRQIALLDAEIQSLQGEIKKKEAELARLKDIRDELVRTYYELLLTQSSFATFLGSETISEAARRLEYVAVVEEDIEATARREEQIRNELAEKKRERERRQAEAEKLRNQEAAKKVDLAHTREGKRFLLEETKGEERRFQELLARFQREREELNRKIAALLAEQRRRSTLARGGGRIPQGPFALPLDPPLIVNCGFRCDLEGKYPFPWPHYGIDLAAFFQPVYASHVGEVVFAATAGCYGGLVVIDHGGLETWYAHLATWSVSPGQVVGRGEVIGRSGNTGCSTGPHLHFEVRIDNNPVNPSPYLGI